MLDDDIGQAAVGRDMRHELFQRIQPAGRGADADDTGGGLISHRGGC